MKRYALLLLLAFFALSACSQSFHKTFLFKPDRTVVNDPKYTLSYTSRLSIINSNPVGIRGVHTGVKFGKSRHRLTLAYFWSNTKPDIQLLNFGNPSQNLLNLDGHLKKDFHYYNLMFYPYWLNSYRWKVSTPVELGIGTTTNDGVSFLSELKPYNQNQFFVPLQIGGYIEFKATRYVGINFEIGQRVILKQKGNEIALNGIYYGLGANLYTGPLWRDFKSWRKNASSSLKK